MHMNSMCVFVCKLIPIELSIEIVCMCLKVVLISYGHFYMHSILNKQQYFIRVSTAVLAQRLPLYVHMYVFLHHKQI